MGTCHSVPPVSTDKEPEREEPHEEPHEEPERGEEPNPWIVGALTQSPTRGILNLSAHRCNYEGAPFDLISPAVKALDIGHNIIRHFPPSLPQTIEKLWCYDSEVVTLPSLLHEGLRVLDCRDNLIETLPPLPSTLERLICYKNKITVLPTTFPAGLVELQLQYNQISARVLPALPPGLVALLVHCCNLTSLPPLPDTLKTLFCGANDLTELPALPDGLEQLDCSRNPFLTSLTRSPSDHLPAALITLDCAETAIRVLPPLPPLIERIGCHDTQIETLPDIPASCFSLLCCRTNIPLRQMRFIEDPFETPQKFVAKLRILEERLRYERILLRTAAIKEELVMEVWSPRRLEKRLEAGEELEDILA